MNKEVNIDGREDSAMVFVLLFNFFVLIFTLSYLASEFSTVINVHLATQSRINFSENQRLEHFGNKSCGPLALHSKLCL